MFKIDLFYRSSPVEHSQKPGLSPFVGIGRFVKERRE